jgi:hypothetical protein
VAWGSARSCVVPETTYSLDDVGIGGDSALEELVKGLNIVGL